VLLKLDFQKAYDTINWDSLDTILKAMGFGQKWRSWVCSCITTTTISTPSNGAPCKPFRLREDDPLSPLLFVIMAEVLNKMLTRAADLELFED